MLYSLLFNLLNLHSAHSHTKATQIHCLCDQKCSSPWRQVSKGCLHYSSRRNENVIGHMAKIKTTLFLRIIIKQTGTWMICVGCKSTKWNCMISTISVESQPSRIFLRASFILDSHMYIRLWWRLPPIWKLHVAEFDIKRRVGWDSVGQKLCCYTFTKVSSALNGIYEDDFICRSENFGVSFAPAASCLRNSQFIKLHNNSRVVSIRIFFFSLSNAVWIFFQ